MRIHLPPAPSVGQVFTPLEMKEKEVYQLHVIANRDKGFTFTGELIDTSGAKDYTFIGTLDFEPAPPAKAPAVSGTDPLFIFGLVVALFFWAAIVALSR
jgi:hypothetical protein